ncbi:MAG TPA: hypothetical protein VF669_14825 [Tepidisphaeraceae bacterium]|jgi:hypothetical protein
MRDVITCPACSAEFPYMPDLVGMKIDCPTCAHPFVVPLPVRRAVTQPAGRSLVPAVAASPRPSEDLEKEKDDLPPLPEFNFEPESTTRADAIDSPGRVPAESLSEVSLDDTLGGEDLAPPPTTIDFDEPDPQPAPLPPKPKKTATPAARKSQASLRTSERPPPDPNRILIVGLLFTALGAAALLLPFLGVSIPKNFLIPHLIFAAASMMVLLGCVICGIAFFRENLKLLLAGTCIAILSLYLYSGAFFSRTASPATIAAAPPSPASALVNSAPPTTPAHSFLDRYEVLASRYGSDKVVQVNIPQPLGQQLDLDLAQQVHTQLRPLAKSWSVTPRADHLQLLFAPVDDVSAFAQSLRPKGTVTSIDETNRTITFAFPSSDN